MSYYVPILNDTLNLTVGFRCGSINESKLNAGISHLVEHLMFKGKNNVLNKLIDHGFRYNAATSYDYTIFYLSCSQNDAKKACDILLTLMGSIDALTLSDFNVEKKVVIEELALYPTRHIQEDLFRMIMRKTPYFNSISGTEKTIKNITLEDAKEYYTRFYTRPFVSFSCSRNIVKNIEKWLAPILKHGRTPLPLPIDLNMNRIIDSQCRIVNKINKNGDSETCRLAYLGFPRYDPRCKIAALIVFIIGTRMFKKVRDHGGKTYTIHMSHDSHAYAGVLTMEFETNHGNLVSILNAFRRTIRDLYDLTLTSLKQYQERLIKHKETLNPMAITLYQLKTLIFGADDGPLSLISCDDFRSTIKTLFDSKRLAFVCNTRSPKNEIYKILASTH